MAHIIVPTVEDGDPFTEDFTLAVRDAVGELQTDVTALQAAVPETSTSFAPATVSGLTKGNGTETAEFVRVGATVFFVWKFVLGSLSAVTGDVLVTLPVGVGNTDSQADALMIDLGTATFLGKGFYTSTQVAARYQTVSNGKVIMQLLSATAPHTWAAGDQIRVSGTYLAA